MSPFRRNAIRRIARRAGLDEASAEALADMRPGRTYELRQWHDPECRKPQGGGCTCRNGPEVELRPMVDPLEN